MNAVASAPQSGYAVCSGDVVTDRQSVLEAWRGNLGDDAQMLAKYDWFYLHSPAGPPLLQLLTHDGEVIGAAAAGPRRMHWPGRGEVTAGIMVDLAVVAEHRSLGPALMLQQAIASNGLQRFELLYGFPNPKSAAVFKRMGYHHVADMQRHARVLRHAPYLGDHLPAVLVRPGGWLLDQWDRLRLGWRSRGLHAQWSDALPEAAATLCQQHPLDTALSSVRDAAHLHWRLHDTPIETFRHLLVRQGDADAPLAWFATRIDDSTLHVIDFACQAPARGMPAACIDVLLYQARKLGLQSVSVECATSPARLQGWQASGFRSRQSRPVFMAFPGDGTEPRALPELHLTAADEDQ